jgi:cbb3-type cytochrome oxidase maturation protein
LRPSTWRRDNGRRWGARDKTAMTVLLFLIPLAVLLGLVGLVAFMWSLKTGQFDDLDGAAHRVLMDDDIEDKK